MSILSIVSRDAYKARKREEATQTADSVNNNCVIAEQNRKSLYVEIGNHDMSIGNHGKSRDLRNLVR